MRTSVSIWDALFGKKAVIQLPDPRGGVKEVRVTVKWMEKMQREGKMKPAPADKQYVQVHILDPEAALMGALFGLEGGSDSTYRVETWVVGENIPIEQYERFIDRNTQALYAMTQYDEDGNRQVYTVQKELWDVARAAMSDG